MKVIFLDIDGVLNTNDYCPKARCGPIHKDKVDILNSVLLTSGAKIVLSSAWRYLVHRKEMDLVGLDWLLRSHGILADRLVGITEEDSLRTDLKFTTPEEWPTYNERGTQIRNWLQGKGVENYVVLDDKDLGISGICTGHFVHVENGLQNEHISILNRMLNE